MAERTNEEISAAIAERLWPGSTKDGHEWRFGKSWVDWSDFAEDHNAALGLIVPEMRKRGYWFFMEDDHEAGLVTVFFTNWSCRVTLPFGQEPRAICLAAEAALGAEGTQG